MAASSINSSDCNATAGRSELEELIRPYDEDDDTGKRQECKRPGGGVRGSGAAAVRVLTSVHGRIEATSVHVYGHV